MNTQSSAGVETSHTAGPEGRFLRAVAVLLCGALLAGCAAGAALRAGQQAEQLKDYDRAVVEYTKAVRLRPDDRHLRDSLQRAKLKAAQTHFFRGNRLDAAGKYEEALLEYQLALELNPTSADIEDRAREARVKLRTKLPVRRERKTEL